MVGAGTEFAELLLVIVGGAGRAVIAAFPGKGRGHAGRQQGRDQLEHEGKQGQSGRSGAAKERDERIGIIGISLKSKVSHRVCAPHCSGTTDFIHQPQHFFRGSDNSPSGKQYSGNSTVNLTILSNVLLQKRRTQVCIPQHVCPNTAVRCSRHFHECVSAPTGHLVRVRDRALRNTGDLSLEVLSGQNSPPGPPLFQREGEKSPLLLRSRTCKRPVCMRVKWTRSQTDRKTSRLRVHQERRGPGDEFFLESTVLRALGNRPGE